MKKFYEPEYSIITFDATDVIATSTCTSFSCNQNIEPAAVYKGQSGPTNMGCLSHTSFVGIPNMPRTRQ